MLKIGIDDAGRGPVLGPMILAGVLLTSRQEKLLKKHNVRDSKAVVHEERIKLAKLIKENSLASKIVKTFPEDIDKALTTGTNLNTLEAQMASKIINELNAGKYKKEKVNVIVDCPSTNTRAWRNTLIKYIEHKENLIISCEHKADVNHVSVSASSILAKVTREEEVAKLKKEYNNYGDIGSGYPSDTATQEFLKKHGKELKNSGLFRKTWQTWKQLFPAEEKGQKTLADF